MPDRACRGKFSQSSAVLIFINFTISYTCRLGPPKHSFIIWLIIPSTHQDPDISTYGSLNFKQNLHNIPVL
jgi:hypothetical protein